MTLDPGIHTLAAEDYHADPLTAPSLSASMAHLLVNHSPHHAWHAHPRLNPNFVREEKGIFDLGQTTHSLILEGDSSRLQVIDAPDWRTKIAQTARDEARAAGRIPLLTKDFVRVEAMMLAVGRQLAVRNDAPPLFTAGKAEQTLVWEERGIQCRARLDWLHDDLSAIDDLKTVGRSANPMEWSRSPLWANGADIQVAFYLRGLKHLTGKDALFRFVLVESSPPHAVSVVSLDTSALDLGRAKVDRAIDLWGHCLKTGNWPGYSSEIYYAEPPPWEELRWMEQDAEVVLS